MHPIFTWLVSKPGWILGALLILQEQEQHCEAHFSQEMQMVSVQSFFFFTTGWHTKIKDPLFPNILDKNNYFHNFPRILEPCEMQKVSFKNWAWIIKLTFYNNDCYIPSSTHIKVDR